MPLNVPEDFPLDTLPTRPTSACPSTPSDSAPRRSFEPSSVTRDEIPRPRRDEVPRPRARRRPARSRSRADALQPRADPAGALPRRREAAGRSLVATSRPSRCASGTPCSTSPRTSRTRFGARSRQLRERVGRYVFVSSISVYADRPVRRWRSRPSQSSSREKRAGRGPETYGARKAAVRADRRGGVRRAGARRSAGPHRRTSRPDRPLHVLAAPRRPAAATCSPPRHQNTPCSSSTFAISQGGSSGNGRRLGGTFNATGEPMPLGQLLEE